MKRATLNASVDTIALLPFLVTAITGIIIWLYLPRGTQQAALGTIASHQTFFSIQRQVWLDVHLYLGLVFTALVTLHLVLHWYYIKTLPQRFSRTKAKNDRSITRFFALLLVGALIVGGVVVAVYASNAAPSSPNVLQNVSATVSPKTTTSKTSTSTPSPTPTSINGIPTSVNGLDYIYYHNLNDRSTCILCHSNV